MKKRYVLSIITLLLITLSFFAYNNLDKRKIIDNKIIGIYLQDENDENNYILSNLNTIPTEGYRLNVEKTNSLCSDATFSYNNNNIEVSTTKPIKCNMYFDIYSIKSMLYSLGYKQIEYIKQTGNQDNNTVAYIQTDLANENGFRFVFDITVDNYGDRGRYTQILGSQDYSNSVYKIQEVVYADGEIRAVGGAYDSSWPILIPYTYDLNTFVHVDASLIKNNSYLKVNDILVNTSNDSSSRGNRSISIFTLNQYNGYRYGGPSTLYSLKVYTSIDDSEIVGDFYPAIRITDNKVGLYDIVTNYFYTAVVNESYLVAGPEV